MLPGTLSMTFMLGEDIKTDKTVDTRLLTLYKA